MFRKQIIRRLTTSSVRSYSIRPEPWQSDTLIDIGVRKIFTDEHDALRTKIRQFYNEVPLERIELWETQGFVDREFWLEAGKMELIGVEQSAEKGGWGKDFKSNMIGLEEQVYAGVSGGFTVQSDLVMPYVESYGTDYQIEKYMKDMRDGKLIGAIAMTEPSAGSDLQGIKTTAVRDGDDWILNGSKVFITNGWNADMVLVVAVTDKTAKKRAFGISIFMVDTNLPGFKKGKLLKKLGLHSSDTAELFFEDVRLPSSALLGGEDGENRGFQFLMHDLGRERLVVSTVCACGMEGVYEGARTFVNQPQASGKPLVSQQQVRHTLAEVKTDAMIARQITDKQIEAYENDDMDQASISMVKLWTSEKLIENVTKCQQLFDYHGVILGSEPEHRVGLAFAAARVQSIYAGTSEVMKEIIARTI